MAIGKVGKNGTLNENGAFYSVQDVNVLLENSGGDVDLPKPTVEDVGKAVVVDEEGKYTLGEGGSGGNVLSVEVSGNPATGLTLNKSYKEIHDVLTDGGLVIFTQKLIGDDIKYWYLNNTGYHEHEATPYTVTLFHIAMGAVAEGQFVSATESGTLTYTPSSP